VKILIFLLLVLPAIGQTVPAHSKQAVVAYPSSWHSSHAELYFYERPDSKAAWSKAGGPIKIRLGRKGSAWGLGLHRSPDGVTLKKEGDGRSPAGIFSIGGAWGDAPAIRKHPKLPYRKVTPRDLWVEDSKSPHYNSHQILPHLPKSTWERKQQMKQNDHAHSLKLFIAHNPPPKAKPDAGSAIFFHIWRGGGSKPTAGCTTMEEGNLKKLVAWVDPTKQPVYILLPLDDYKAKRTAWKLP
jgi:L,D-peptidoglycan transpeptidase YkuD (ErfK/YbiS/YcfS/YnhG family)